jgi:hypothetical protein
MKKGIDIIIKIALLGLIVFLAYKIVIGIKSPIDLEAEKTRRFNLTIDRLKDIRTAQIAYKELHGNYTPYFDTLLDYIKTGNLRVVRAIGFVPDTLSEKKALELGIISRDTFLIPVKDSLFKHLKYPLDSIRYIPTGTKTQFFMDTASVMTGSGIEVKVFEATASYDNILEGLDRQFIINTKDTQEKLKKDPTLRVGNLKEANNNAGNWE